MAMRALGLYLQLVKGVSLGHTSAVSDILPIACTFSKGCRQSST